jgi:hypothetical protein
MPDPFFDLSVDISGLDAERESKYQLSARYGWPNRIPLKSSAVHGQADDRVQTTLIRRTMRAGGLQ